MKTRQLAELEIFIERYAEILGCDPEPTVVAAEMQSLKAEVDRARKTISGLRKNGELRVARAAIRTDNGEIFSVEIPGRHNDLIKLMRESGYEGPVSGDRQGFILSDGRFTSRKGAMTAAVKAGQVVREDCYAPNVGLFSEDVW